MALAITAIATAVTALATAVLVGVNAFYAVELAQAHRRSIEPHLHWEGPRREVEVMGAGTAVLKVNMRNVGAGPARLTAAKIESSLGAKLSIRGLSVPSTFPVGVQYAFDIEYPDFVGAHINAANEPLAVTITFSYTDVESRYCYRTKVSINATQHLPDPMGGPIVFLVKDERPARDRRVKCA